MANGAASGINATFQKNCITCLHIAAKNDLKEMVQLLIQNRCNPNIQAKGGVLAVDEATDEEVSLKVDYLTHRSGRCLLNTVQLGTLKRKKVFTITRERYI